MKCKVSIGLLWVSALLGVPTFAEESAAAPIGHPLNLQAEGLEDLEFLAPLLEGKRIVQLGENTHGVHEYNVAKARIVRYLHQELGYDVLAFESSIYQCYDADLTAASHSALSTLRGCTFGVWHTPAVAELFEYIKATRSSDRPLYLAGFDVQPIGRNKEDRPQFLAEVVGLVDTDYAAEVEALDSKFLEVYGRGGKERRQVFRGPTGSEMAEAYDEVVRFLEKSRPTLEKLSPAEGAVGIAIRTASSMASYIRFVSAPSNLEYSERRDQGMAENLSYLIDDHYAGRKIIVWGHNFHLRHANADIPPREVFPYVPARTMGTWIHDRYGEDLYTVGLYAYRGQAADNRGDHFEVKPAPAGSLEGWLHTLGHEVLFVPLTSGNRPSGRGFDERTEARFNATVPQEMIVRDQYDAVLFFDEVTPRRALD